MSIKQQILDIRIMWGVRDYNIDSKLLPSTMNVNSNLSLDPHLQLKLIEFQQKQGPLSEQLKAKRLQLLLKTKLYSSITSTISQLSPNDTKLSAIVKEQELKTKQEEKQLGGSATIDDLFDLEDDIKDHQYTVKEEELLKKSYQLARIYYETGDYTEARSILGQLDFFIEKGPHLLPVAWGKLTSDILLEKTDLVEATKKLKAKIESVGYPSVQAQIYQKEAFLNICCFVFFQRNKEEDFEAFLDICNEASYFSTIQMVCPYIFRYMCVALLLNKSYQRYGNFNRISLINALERNLFNYSDPLVEFVRKVLVKFDFEGAESSLQGIDVLKTDYFIHHLFESIKTSSQVLYYQTYCKIYESLPIKSISKFLNKDNDESEEWIVQLFRRSGIKARIDSISGVIDINRTAWLKSNQASSVEELIPRTNTIVNNLARILVE